MDQALVHGLQDYLYAVLKLMQPLDDPTNAYVMARTMFFATFLWNPMFVTVMTSVLVTELALTELIYNRVEIRKDVISSTMLVFTAAILERSFTWCVVLAAYLIFLSLFFKDPASVIDWEVRLMTKIVKRLLKLVSSYMHPVTEPPKRTAQKDTPIPDLTREERNRLLSVQRDTPIPDLTREERNRLLWENTAPVEAVD
jgi:hypothetical protein